MHIRSFEINGLSHYNLPRKVVRKHVQYEVELCHCVEDKPSLQPLSGEPFQFRSEVGACLVAVANSFLECRYVEVFNSLMFSVLISVLQECVAGEEEKI